jgi:hypothetical protein
MMRQLEISLAVQAKIENAWNRIEREDWLLIEEKALEWLTADLAVTVYLSPLAILSEALPKFYKTLAGYTGFEEAQMDHAVFQAASWVLGRPAFAGQWSRRDTETFRLDDYIEIIHIPKPPSSPLPSSRPRAVRRRLGTLQRRRNEGQCITTRSFVENCANVDQCGSQSRATS